MLTSKYHTVLGCLLMLPFFLSAQPTNTDKIGFGSLFTHSYYDPQKPYLTQLSPKAMPFVQAYIRKQGKELERMKGWGQPYLGLYSQILTAHGVPAELKYLSVIESHLQSTLRSWAGAVGPWQLMDYEAKRFGLKVAPGIDERTNYIKSTEAAAKLLKELFDQFGDWLLVVAAYNGGAGRVKQAIRKSGSRDFWDLQMFLKEETRLHVKKFIGTHYIFEGGGGVTTMTRAEVLQGQPQQVSSSTAAITDIDSLRIGGRYLATTICIFLQLSRAQFQQLNPAFDQTLATGKQYMLKLPKENMQQFIAHQQMLLNTSMDMLMKNEAH